MSDIPAIVSSIEQYMDELGWNQADLARAVGVSPAQVSAWFNRQRPRPILRGYINRIAWAIAGAKLDQLPLKNPNPIAPEAFWTMDRLDDILNGLLKDAQYSAFPGSGQDRVWSRLSQGRRDRRVLRAGWVHYPYFCSISRGTDARAKPSGIAVHTMEVIAQLIGVELLWQKYEWSDVLDGVLRGEIDVVCPTLMKLPERLFRVALSEPLPGIDIGFNVIVNKFTAESVRNRLRTHEEVVVGYVQGEIGETLHRLVIPGSMSNRAFLTFQEAIEALARTPDESTIDCIVADHMICTSIVDESSNLSLIADHPREPGLRLTVAAAVHPDEKRLLAVIDDCIEIMRGTKYFQKEIYASPSGRKLLEAGVFDEKMVPEVKDALKKHQSHEAESAQRAH